MAMIIEDQEGKWVCGACACVGIKNLGLERDAPSAMREFCRLQLVFENTGFQRRGQIEPYRTLTAFYVFVAGPEVQGKFWSRPWTKYGTEFAQYITDNNLGLLTTLGQADNALWHRGEGTTCQVWLWKPDRAALIKWYESQPTTKETI